LKEEEFMTITKKKFALGILLGSLFLMSHTALAATWSTSGSVCEPGVESAGLYTLSGAKFLFSGTNTGEIKARCQVTNPMDSGVPPWSTMVVGYQDPDGTGINYQVTAQLIRVDKSSGASTIIKTFSSNSFVGTGATSHNVSFTHTFDFDSNAYYVTLTLDRVDSSNNPAFWFVQLK
jgi:hypothetical protein